MYRLVSTLIHKGWAIESIYGLLSNVPRYKVRYAILEAICAE